MRVLAMTHRLRSAALGGLVVVLLAGLACGRYGPPRRIEARPPVAPPAATATDSAPTQTQPSEPHQESDREP